MIIEINQLTIGMRDGIPVCSGEVKVSINGRSFSGSWDGHCILKTTDGYQFTIKTEIPHFPPAVVTGVKFDA